MPFFWVSLFFGVSESIFFEKDRGKSGFKGRSVFHFYSALIFPLFRGREREREKEGGGGGRSMLGFSESKKREITIIKQRRREKLWFSLSPPSLFSCLCSFHRPPPHPPNPLVETQPWPSRYRRGELTNLSFLPALPRIRRASEQIERARRERASPVLFCFFEILTCDLNR